MEKETLNQSMNDLAMEFQQQDAFVKMTDYLLARLIVTIEKEKE